MIRVRIFAPVQRTVAHLQVQRLLALMAQMMTVTERLIAAIATAILILFAATHALRRIQKKKAQDVQTA